jgi:urease accessory protein
LLQLVSPALPVGAYSYSEGVEALVEADTLPNQAALHHWLVQELQIGSIRLEAAVMLRCYHAIAASDGPQLCHWNRWLTALRETEELRNQSLQMGRSLLKLWLDLQPEAMTTLPLPTLRTEGCHFATAFAIAATHGQIEAPTAVLGYLYSWAANLVSAGIKLIPLGQTAGQQTLLQLHPILEQTVNDVLHLPDESLEACGWGLAIASMTHETQYSRLFRS